MNFYENGAGNLPGNLVQSRPNLAFTNGPSFSIPITPVVGLVPGAYWVSVQANQTYNTTGQWGWRDRTVTSNNGAAWRNPSGGFQPPLCTSWGRRATTCNIDPASPDQVYRLLGTTGPPPTAASTATAATGHLLHGRGDRDPRLGEWRPVPVELRVSGLTGTITDVNLSINGYSHTCTDDVDVMLAHPAPATNAK